MKLVWPGEQRNQAVGLLADHWSLIPIFSPIEVAKLLLVVGAVVVLAITSSVSF